MQGIMEKIKNDTKSRIKAIEGERDKEIAGITGMARKEAAEIRKLARDKAAKEAEMEEKRIVSRANLLAKKAEAEMVDSLFEEIIAGAKKDLGRLRADPAYRQKLNSVVQRAVEEIPSSQVTIELPPEDARLLKLKRVSGKNVQLKKVKGAMTGAMVKSRNGTVRIDCTFEALLSEKKQAFKKELMKEIK